MAAPSAYDENTLADYMQAALGQTATALDLEAAEGDFTEAVNDALLLYGADSIDDATDIDKLRAAARLAAWRMVEAQTAAHYQRRVGDVSLNRQQIHEHAVAMVRRMRVEAFKYGIDHSISVVRERRIDDPYAVLSDAQRGVSS